MTIAVDLHIHSRYSRACSKSLELPAIAMWAQKKGIDIVATGDFTHPVWFAELKAGLRESEPGLYMLAGSDCTSRFILSTEISCIYKKNGRTRKLHLLILAPSLQVVEKLNSCLAGYGNISYDGRPILGMDARDLLKLVLDIHPGCMVIPAHAWTPWFAIFGSKSGFDTIEECFDELSGNIYAIETGLSSDPPMNWLVSSLDRITLVSNSDAHSLQNIGREANIFNMAIEEATYDNICNVIREKDSEKFLYTVEFFPEQGMYHLDGHRNCSIRFTPEETAFNDGICPVCKKGVTVGVLSRVCALADRKPGYLPKRAIGYKRLVGLDHIIAAALGLKGRTSKSVTEQYEKLTKIASELDILLHLPYEELLEMTSPRIVDGVKRTREARLVIEAGYDGEYGTIKIFDDKPTRPGLGF